MSVLVLLEATAKVGCVNELKTLLNEHFPVTRAMEGCRDLKAYLDSEDGRTMVFVEHWDTREAYQKYLAWRTEKTDVAAKMLKMIEDYPRIRFFEMFDG
jgi:quinol monooxygenase YgiN